MIMPEYKHEAHCQFEGLGPCQPCRSESPRTCTVASLFTKVPQQNRTPHAAYITPQGLSGHSACAASMFGYPIGAHGDRPSVSASPGRWKRGCGERAWFPLRRVGRVRTAPLQGDLRSTGTRRTLQVLSSHDGSEDLLRDTITVMGVAMALEVALSLGTSGPPWPVSAASH